jgi:Protein of unknown function (DUF4244)
VSEVLMRVWCAFVRLTNEERSEAGQSTAEYALVMIAAAAVAGLVLMWAHKTNLVSGLFNGVIGKVVKGITGG